MLSLILATTISHHNGRKIDRHCCAKRNKKGKRQQRSPALLVQRCALAGAADSAPTGAADSALTSAADSGQMAAPVSWRLASKGRRSAGIGPEVDGEFVRRFEHLSRLLLQGGSTSLHLFLEKFRDVRRNV
ncbi:Uncharacterized protein Fot_30042 [Forsythia ovata]|uniref:Uncharacterized protein n=1 Tax=Forsythia ovata TaxID=205694 RepID=A0ABD1TTN0_9LAMI